MYRIFSSILPKKFRKSFESLLLYNNIKIDAESFLGFLIAFGLGISVGLAFYPSAKFNINFFAMVVIIFVAIESLVLTSFYMQADKKSKSIELVVPDFLQLMSSNLRAGMTTDKALLLSARDEFGHFQVEISRLGKEISTGKEIDVALLDMSKRVKSDKLEKTVLLLVNGIKSGGQLAELLDQTANNLRNQKIVEEKIRSNVLLYVIFVFTAVSFGAPMLFGLSTYLVQVISDRLSTIDIPQEASSTLPIQIGQATIDPSFVINYAIISLLISSLFGSIVIGLIAKGQAKYGIKFLPFISGISMAVFFLTRYLISTFLTEIFGL